MFFGKKKNKEIVNQVLPDKRAIKSTEAVGFDKIEFMSLEEQKLFSFLKNNLSEEYTLFPKVRLLEFARPSGNDAAVKKSILDVQNITCDFLIVKNSFDIIAIIQCFSNENISQAQEEKLKTLTSISELISVSFIRIASVSDAFSNEILVSYFDDKE